MKHLVGLNIMRKTDRRKKVDNSSVNNSNHNNVYITREVKLDVKKESLPPTVVYPNLDEEANIKRCTTPDLKVPPVKHCASIVTRSVSADEEIPEVEAQMITRDADTEECNVANHSELEHKVRVLSRLCEVYRNTLTSDAIVKKLSNTLKLYHKIVLYGEDLITLIATLLDVSFGAVTIEYEEENSGCCAATLYKLGLRTIDNVKISVGDEVYDFKLCYNSAYNAISSTFNIDLTHCYI